MSAFDTLREDLKQSLRQFTKSPGFTFAAVAALTLGIGVNTAIFSVVNAVLLKPIGLPDPDRVVLLMNVGPNGSGGGSSPAKLQHFAAQTDAVRDVAGFRIGVASYTGGSFPEELASAQVTADFFRLVGAPVALGRTFTASEDAPGGGHVVVLSQAQWRSRFNGDPGIVGKSMQLNGQPHTIVGVLGDFDFREFEERPIQVWTPFQFEPASNNHAHYFQAVGRPAPGVSLADAQALIGRSAEVFRAKFPGQLTPKGSLSVTPVRDVLVRGAERTLLVLSG